jgi:hypothetical protein
MILCSIVFNDFQKIIELSSKIGLSLNYKKCELLIISDNTTIKSILLKDFSNIAPGISLQEFDNISLLGCPLTNGGISKSIKEKINTFKRFSNGLIVIYLTSSCVIFSFHSSFKLVHSCQKKPKLHKNKLNTTFFCSTRPLKAPNR